MSGIVPTLGRIVWFYARRLPGRTDQQAARGCGAGIGLHRWKKNGAMIHVGNPVEAGQIVPAMIVAVWGDTPESAVLTRHGEQREAADRS